MKSYIEMLLPRGVRARPRTELAVLRDNQHTYMGRLAHRTGRIVLSNVRLSPPKAPSLV